MDIGHNLIEIITEKIMLGLRFFLNLKDVFKRFVNEITSRNFEDINDNTFTIYGEWCGGNIQKVWVFQIYKIFLYLWS
jgi:hypothetical protein